MKFKNRTIRGGSSLDQLNWNASMKSDERQKANYTKDGKGRKKRKKERRVSVALVASNEAKNAAADVTDHG